MTRRQFILSLFGASGAVVATYGGLDILANKRKMFESEYFTSGKFRNIYPASVMNKGTTLDTAKRLICERKDRFPETKFQFKADEIPRKPSEALNVMWTSHSSVYLEIEGKRIFCDPVWSKVLSPVGFGGPNRFFDNPLDIYDIPELDGVIVSHDHMDHLDQTIVEYLSRNGVSFYVPIGVDHILKSWGVPQDQIHSTDWYGSIVIDDSIKLTSLPTVHFSGRGLFDRNKSQWTSWVIEGKKKRVYFGGDSGYHDGFKEYGEHYGPFDMTFLEIGAYDKNWDKAHLGPKLAVQAHQDLRGEVLLPIHWGAYDLAMHPWREPVEKVIEAAKQNNVNLCLPKPGQLLSEDRFVLNSRWWEV